MNLKRRKFLSLLGIAAFSKTLVKGKESKTIQKFPLSPTHMIIATPKKIDSDYFPVQFPCALKRMKNAPIVGDTITRVDNDTNANEQEEYIIIKIETLEPGAFVESIIEKMDWDAIHKELQLTLSERKKLLKIIAQTHHNESNKNQKES